VLLDVVFAHREVVGAHYALLGAKEVRSTSIPLAHHCGSLKDVQYSGGHGEGCSIL
jgi:hypothetical protein